MIRILLYSLPLSIVSLQHAFFFQPDIKTPPSPHTHTPPRKFAHLDYTALQNIPPEIAEIERCDDAIPHPLSGQTVPSSTYMVIRFAMPLLPPLPSRHFRPFDMLNATSCPRDTAVTTK